MTDAAIITEAANQDGEVETLRDWHGRLQRNRGGRAALRRAQKLDDIYDGVGPFFELLNRYPKVWHEDVARMAIALAEVEDDYGTPARKRPVGTALGRVLAKPAGTGKPLSEQRLRLLASAEDPDQFLRLLRSALHQIGRKAPLADVGRVARLWGSPVHRPWVRRNLFLAFFGAVAHDDTDDRPDAENQGETDDA